MSFEFLAPDTAVAFEGDAPWMRSPIEWTHRDAGAEFGERAGWRVVARYGDAAEEASACRDAVGIADICFLGKLELQAESAAVADIVAALAGGAVLAPGRAVLHDDVWWCPVTPERVLAVTPPEPTAEVREQLHRGAGDRFASVIELTTASARTRSSGRWRARPSPGPRRSTCGRSASSPERSRRSRSPARRR